MNIDIGLEQNARKKIAHDLGIVLADTYVVYVKTQNFHWNVVDRRFYSLHLFFEKQYEELEESIDEVAERIRKLGERTPATLKQFLEMTTLKESKGDLSGDEMINQLLHDHESIIKSLRGYIEHASKLHDEGTADLLIQHLRFHEKTAWMLRSHLNGDL